MKPIGIQRIEARLDAFDKKIDMSDLGNRPHAKLREHFLSRALAAYCIKVLANTDLDSAAKSITDMFHDRGIDAIYYDLKSSQLFILQSKWSDGLGWKECGEFIDGVRKLVDADWTKFSNNKRISDRAAEIQVALEDASRIVLVTVHHGAQRADAATLRRVDDLVKEIDGGSDIARSIHWHQADLLDAIRADSDPPKVNADLYLCNWGEITDPYRAVFGRVQAQALVDLWRANPQLCHLNLREYANRTDVNIAIAETVREEPSHFWYFNNGLTIICDSYKPGIIGRLSNKEAAFHFDGLNLVNGAQTTGIVSDYLDKLSEADRAKIWIQVRIIELKASPEGFESRITRFTNLQNAVSLQDFVALDPVQPRLATDFAVVGRRYMFKWGGDKDPVDDEGCSVRESTVALACAEQDPWFAVQAKREISVLWQTDSARYKTMFHKITDGHKSVECGNHHAGRRFQGERVLKRQACKSQASSLSPTENHSPSRFWFTRMRWVVGEYGSGESRHTSRRNSRRTIQSRL
jgi:AIPR protein